MLPDSTAESPNALFWIVEARCTIDDHGNSDIESAGFILVVISHCVHDASSLYL